MQQVQDHLEFKIDTPSDDELKRVFEKETERLNKKFNSLSEDEHKKTLSNTKNSLKRQRKKAKKKAKNKVKYA